MAEQSRKILFSREKIATEIKRLGQEITRDYGDEEIVLVGVLKGSFLFIADLIREIKTPTVVDFVRLASYGSGTQTSGIIEFRKGLEMSIRDRHVIVVEDIVDSGYTLECLYNKFLLQEPRSLKICTLIDKRARRPVGIQIHNRPYLLFPAVIQLDFRAPLSSFSANPYPVLCNKA